MFGVGVFALTIGVILTTVYMERSQSLPPRHTQSFQPLEVQVDMPEPLEADTGDEQHIGEPQGLLVTELPIPSSLQLLSSEGPVIERNASPSASSALRSNIFTTTLGSETSSLTSMDDTRTIITDKIEGRQDKQEDPNGPTPAEQLLSHVTGGSTEIEIKPWMQHPKPLMKRTHSNGIGQRGRTNSDDVASTGSDRSIESSGESKISYGLSRSPSTTSSHWDEMETRRVNSMNRIPNNLDERATGAYDTDIVLETEGVY